MRTRGRVLVATVGLMAVTGWYVAFRAAAFTFSLADELNRATALTAFTPRPQATLVFDRAGNPAFSFFVEQRTAVPLDRISPLMTDALLAVEDRRFYAHRGLDPIRIAGAAWRNFRAGRIEQGGSTITQQLARALQLSPVRTYERKIREAMIALRLEQRYTKREILTEYLNTVYFGEGYYGVEAASHGYFGKSAADLEPAEAALLAALVRSPSTDAPAVSAARAKRRRDLVLRLMCQQGRLSDAQLQVALARPLPSSPGGAAPSAPGEPSLDAGLYFQEEVRRQLVSMFGAERVLRDGLRVYTTYDPSLQIAAERAVTERIARLAAAHTRAKDLQGSLVAMDPLTGDVLALVGGRDFHASAFNRATQARRQAGSAFKPIIFAAALERGYSPGSLLRDLDTPIEAGDGAWLPGGGHEEPEYTLRQALKVSSNRAAAQLLQQVGLSTAVYYAHRLGIDSDLPMVPSLALGTGEVTLLELTSAYTAFANRGFVSSPRLITRVTDSAGNEIWTAPARTIRAISPATAFLMSSMLADVVSGGTAAGARSAGFKLPAAGKTGTTDDYADAWFVGYTPHLVTGVWFGLDRPAPIMTAGFAGVVAVPAWAQFMKTATRGASPDWYEVPPDVEKVAICRLTGKRATEACRHAPPVVPDAPAVSDPAVVASYPPSPVTTEKLQPPVYEDYFPIGVVPADTCPIHGAAVPAATSGVVVDASPGALRPAAARMVVEQVSQPDGTYRLVIRERE